MLKTTHDNASTAFGGAFYFVWWWRTARTVDAVQGGLT